MTRLTIENATYVVTVDDTDQVLRDTTITIDDGVITAIGPAGTTGRGPGEVIDARGKLVMPGLVNLHTHLPMTLLRGLAEDVDLDGFLSRVWAAEGAVMDPETVELGATLGALESLRGGCTTQLDMYFHHEAAHRGAVAAGSRHVIGPVFFDGPGPDGLTWDQRLSAMRAWPGLLDEIGGPSVPVGAMPHATYTCSPEGFAEVVAVLRELVAGGERDGILTTHVSETAAENAGIRERYDATPTELLARSGWIERDLPLVVGHGVHLSEGDRELLAAGGAAVGHCPGSNLKLASGALPWEVVARQRSSRRPGHRRLLELERPGHVAGHAPGRPAGATHERPARRRQRARGAARRDDRGRAGAGAGRRHRLGRGRQARRPRARRPRGTAPHAGARRRGAARVRGRSRGRHRRARRRDAGRARPSQHPPRHGPASRAGPGARRGRTRRRGVPGSGFERRVEVLLHGSTSGITSTRETPAGRGVTARIHERYHLDPETPRAAGRLT